jgi:formylglycine-generating enzyme required for sulfatase activity
MKKRIVTLSGLALFIALTSFLGGRKWTHPKGFEKSFTFIEGNAEHTSGFFMQRTEVSNLEYRNFLQDLKVQGNMDNYKAALWDTANWVTTFSFNEPYKTYYHSHAAYDNYPAVNITHAGAVLYCEWLAAELNGVSGQGEYYYHVRIPSRSEWIHAACNGDQRFVYAWGGPYIRNAKGCALCNFMHVGDECIRRNESGEFELGCQGGDHHYMGVAGYLSDNADITAPVASYSPSKWGLFNMNGNVAEMVDDGTTAMGGSWRCPGYDVRNTSEMKFDGPSVEVGFRPVVTLVKRKSV